MRLAGKNVSEMTYFVSGGTWNFNSVNQLAGWGVTREVPLCSCINVCVAGDRQHNEEFQYTVNRLEAACDCQLLPLSSFLILPMHRITRIPLLVGAVCRRMESMSTVTCPREITRCLSILQKVSHVLFFRHLAASAKPLLLGCPIVPFVCLVRHCYHDISWMAWTVLIKLTG